MSDRITSLIGESYSICSFRKLPDTHKLAIIWYMAIDGCAWDNFDHDHLNEDALKEHLPAMLHHYDEVYGETLVGFIQLGVEKIKASVMADDEISDSHDSWDEYHAWYLNGGDIPSHSENNRWPVILSSDNSETLTDGWHRFHRYMSSEKTTFIPAVFFPNEEHIKLFHEIKKKKEVIEHSLGM